ncbi:MAG: hypothetical protein DRP64_19115 [Verrucomicrobia bacterium]|nr:MAG: hypothetical protein DRP64_19115 [Verrucomicrobiota bacterium]
MKTEFPQNSAFLGIVQVRISFGVRRELPACVKDYGWSACGGKGHAAFACAPFCRKSGIARW